MSSCLNSHFWIIKLLEKATPWKAIHLTSRLLSTTFSEEQPGIKPRSPECQPDTLTTNYIKQLLKRISSSLGLEHFRGYQSRIQIFHGSTFSDLMILKKIILSEQKHQINTWFDTPLVWLQQHQQADMTRQLVCMDYKL